MSETAPSAPPPAPTETQSTNQELESAATDLAAGFERTPDTLGETEAKAILSKAEEHAQPEADNKATWRIRVLNGMDRAQSAAAMQGLRQYGQEARAARLERKLLTVKPGSKRANRIQYKLNALETSTNRINAKRGKVFGRMHERSRGFEEEVKKVAEIEKKRNKFIVDRRVAIEKKRREKIEKQHKRETNQADPSLRQRLRQELRNDQHRRERLANEIKSWENNSIATFKQKLMAEVQEKYDSRMRTKTL